MGRCTVVLFFSSTLPHFFQNRLLFGTRVVRYGEMYVVFFLSEFRWYKIFYYHALFARSRGCLILNHFNISFPLYFLCITSFIVFIPTSLLPAILSSFFYPHLYFLSSHLENL